MTFTFGNAFCFHVYLESPSSSQCSMSGIILSSETRHVTASSAIGEQLS